MAKKFLILLIAVMLIFCITSCGDKETEFTVTLKVDGADYGSLMASDKTVDLPTPAVPADKADTHLFDYWYYIDSNTGSNVRVDNDYFVTSPLTKDITLHAEFIEILSVSYNQNDGGYYIDGLGKSGVITELVIAEKYTTVKGEYPIVGISKDAFKNEAALTKVVLPDTVKTVGSGAFAGCTNLKEVVIPGDLDSVGTRIFGSVKNNNAVTGLKSITAPAEIVSQIESKTQLETAVINGGKNIADGCFKGATNLKSVEIAKGVETIGAAAFDHCEKITSIKIPATVSEIAIDAFAYCSALASISVDAANEYYSSNGCNYISCNAMTTVDEYGVETVRENVLIAGCKNTVIDGVNYIEQYAFCGANGLKSVVIYGNVIGIHEEAFLGCSSISEIAVNSNTSKYYSDNSNCLVDKQSGRLILGCKNTAIPLSVTEISAYAFRDAAGLETLYIPAGVKTIEAGSFASCAKIANITIDPKNTGLVINDGAFNASATIINASIPAEYAAYFAGVAAKSLTVVEVTAGAAIPSGAFAGCTALTTVNLHDCITEIGEGAFKGCTKLASLTVGADVEEICNNAFNGCSSLSVITVNGEDTVTGADGKPVFVLPASVTNVGDYAFAGTAIASLTIDNIDSIGYMVFGNCSKLASVVIGDGVSVDYDAFTGSGAIAYAEVPADVIRCLASANGSLVTLKITSGDTVEAYSLRDASSLKDLVIGESVTNINSRAFEGCSNLESITVSGSNYTVEGNCLIKDGVIVLGCKTSDLTLVESATVIGEYAFSGSNIAELDLGADWTVSNYAFVGCKNLKKITVAAGDWTGKIGKYSFDGCDKITDATLPTSAIGYFTWSSLKNLTINGGEEIPENAFRGCVTLESVDLGDTVTAVGENAFKGCTGIKTATVPNVAALASIDGTSLEELTLLSAERVITAEDLSGFGQLKSIALPANCRVRANAFEACANIEKADVPAGVLVYMNTDAIVDLTINSGRFANEGLLFGSLERLTLEGDATINAVSFVGAPKLAAIAADSSVYTAEGNTLVAGDVVALASVNSVIPSSVSTVGTYAFAGREITAVTVPANVTKIDVSAFESCEALTACTVMGAAEICDEAFGGCLNLASIALATGVQVSDSAFAGCANITTLSIPADVAKNISNVDNLTTLTIVSGNLTEALWEVNSLETLIIGADVALVSGSAISGNSCITAILVDAGNSNYVDGGNCVLTKDGKTLVLGCQSTVIPASVATIESNAFKGCVGITELNIPANVTEIKENAFGGCSGIVAITVDAANSAYVSVNNAILTKDGTTLVLGCQSTVIPETVTAIGAYAFNGAAGLETILIPASVETVGVGAFEYCTSLTEVVFADGSMIASFASGLFLGCESLAKVVVPGAVEAIAADAFFDCYGVTVYYCNTADYEDAIEAMLDGNTAIYRIVYYSRDYSAGCWVYNGNNIFEY